MDSDPTPAQIARTARPQEGNSGLYQFCQELRDAGVTAEYFNWNGTRAGQIATPRPAAAAGICDLIRERLDRHPGERLAIVGNSWGGHTAWEVCDQLYRSDAPLAVEQVIFLDPSSAGRAETTRPQHLPANINQATNYFTRNLFVWRNWPGERRLENIDLGDAKQGYMKNGVPAYHAAFSFPAHVAAEWDPRIHQNIKQRLLQTISGELLPENRQSRTVLEKNSGQTASDP